MKRAKTMPRRVREAIRRDSVSKALRERCEEMAAAAGFQAQEAGPYGFHMWIREMPDKRLIIVSRPAPFGHRHDESWVGHHGDPNKKYWSLGLGLSETPSFENTRAMHELTLSEAFELAAQLERGETVLASHADNVRH